MDNKIIYRVIRSKSHEFLLHASEPRSEFNAIVSIHNTAYGPAFGGCRIRSYPRLIDAIADAQFLSEAMTYKSTFYDLPYGGGKAVLIGSPTPFQKRTWMTLFGNVLNKLNGLYETADDMGTSIDDMEYLRTITPFARGVYQYDRTQVPATSYGVFLSLKAAAKQALGTDALQGTTIAVQGLGKVGWNLCHYLHQDGANIVVADLDGKLADQASVTFNAKVIAPEQIATCNCDIFSPCAVGGVITEQFIKSMHAKIVVGGANNPLRHERLAQLMHDKEITFVPDFVANAGGVIDVICEGTDYSAEKVFSKVKKIYKKTSDLLDAAAVGNKAPLFIAKEMVETKLALAEKEQEECAAFLELSA